MVCRLPGTSELAEAFAPTSPLLSGLLAVDPSLGFGEAVVQWSVRFAILFYLLRLYLDLRSAHRHAPWDQRNARRLWTCGLAFYLLHVAASFAVYHQWSHAAAYRHTAEQTLALTGINWGGGLYANYAFTFIWLADVAAWWRCGIRFPYRRPVYLWSLHAVFGFMIINATVVFGPPFWRWIAFLIGLLLVYVWRYPRESR